MYGADALLLPAEERLILYLNMPRIKAERREEAWKVQQGPTEESIEETWLMKTGSEEEAAVARLEFAAVGRKASLENYLNNRQS